MPTPRLTAFITTVPLAFLGVFGLVAWALSAPAAVAAYARPAVSAWSFLGAFAVATAVMLAMLRMFRSAGAVVALLRVSLVLGVVLLFWRLGGEALAVAAVPTSVLAAFLYRRVWAVDLTVLAAAAGIAAEVGSAMHPWTAVLVLSVLAAYDLIAVFGTKHMVFMAERLMGERAIFALAIPLERRVWLDDFAKPTTPRQNGLLGLGDLVLPAILFAAAFRVGAAPALAVVAGTLAGVVALAWWQERRGGRPLPALPPLALGAVVGFLLWLLL